MTLQEVKDRLFAHFSAFVDEDDITQWYLQDAANTMFYVLDVAMLLEDKFGSLEQALDAEIVTHCRECVAYKTEEFTCLGILGDENKVMLPDDHCSRALTKEQYEKLLQIAEKMERANCMSPEELTTLHVAGEE